MDIPSPGMIRKPGTHFDQTVYPPFDEPFHFFTPNIELPDNVKT